MFQVIPGDWYSVLKAANDTKKITENGELSFYIRRLRCSEGCEKLNIDFYTKVNGICQTHSIESTKRENDTYEVDSKVPQVKKREYDNFKNFSQKKGITEEKIEDVTVTVWVFGATVTFLHFSFFDLKQSDNVDVPFDDYRNKGLNWCFSMTLKEEVHDVP
ncbi:Epididymal-Specific Lipocalin-9 [Manis pentadactyla]|nr:Epididymal-Specific Lipocalin-9 [Manis pentadactyla]